MDHSDIWKKTVDKIHIKFDSIVLGVDVVGKERKHLIKRIILKHPYLIKMEHLKYVLNEKILYDMLDEWLPQKEEVEDFLFHLKRVGKRDVYNKVLRKWSYLFSQSKIFELLREIFTMP